MNMYAYTRSGRIFRALPEAQEVTGLPPFGLPATLTPRRAQLVEAARKQREAYPCKDPRTHPFTGRVPPIPDAEAKEAGYYELQEDLVSCQIRKGKLNPMLRMGHNALDQRIGEIRSELAALEAELQ